MYGRMLITNVLPTIKIYGRGGVYRKSVVRNNSSLLCHSATVLIKMLHELAKGFLDSSSCNSTLSVVTNKGSSFVVPEIAHKTARWLTEGNRLEGTLKCFVARVDSSALLHRYFHRSRPWSSTKLKLRYMRMSVINSINSNEWSSFPPDIDKFRR